jgi:hypothetical protein
MRTIIVGDIHGCHRELDILLDRLEHRPEDHIIFVGDLIHRGPDSGLVVRTVKELAERRRVTIVEGNHEEKHRRWRKAVAENRVDKMRHIEHYPAAEEQMKAAGVQGWLDQPLPYFVRLPEYGATVIHGGLLPDHDLMPEANAPTEMTGKVRKLWKKVLRVRHVSPEGKMVKLGDKTNDDVFWPKLYDGRFGRVFFGHQPFARDGEPRDYGNATSLDLGCVFGGRLVAAVLNGKGAEPEFVTVEALDTYSEEWSEED